MILTRRWHPGDLTQPSQHMMSNRSPHLLICPSSERSSTVAKPPWFHRFRSQIRDHHVHAQQPTEATLALAITGNEGVRDIALAGMEDSCWRHTFLLSTFQTINIPFTLHVCLYLDSIPPSRVVATLKPLMPFCEISGLLRYHLLLPFYAHTLLIDPIYVYLMPSYGLMWRRTLHRQELGISIPMPRKVAGLLSTFSWNRYLTVILPPSPSKVRIFMPSIHPLTTTFTPHVNVREYSSGSVTSVSLLCYWFDVKYGRHICFLG